MLENVLQLVTVTLSLKATSGKGLNGILSNVLQLVTVTLSLKATSWKGLNGILSNVLQLVTVTLSLKATSWKGLNGILSNVLQLVTVTLSLKATSWKGLNGILSNPPCQDSMDLLLLSDQLYIRWFKFIIFKTNYFSWGFSAKKRLAQVYWRKIQIKELSLRHKLWFSNTYISAIQCRRP